MQPSSAALYFILSVSILFMMGKPLSAQHLLNKKLSVNVHHRSMQQALVMISHEGNFHFSYNSNLLPGDSMVSISVKQKAVKEILQLLLGNAYEYRESGSYIIIRKSLESKKTFLISGYVVNKKTGEKVPYASVYDKQTLISTLTDQKGYFRLRIRSYSPAASISVNKLYYQDTSFMLTAESDKQITLFISPIRSITLDSVTVTPYSKMGSNWFGNFFISSKQAIQDINLSNFFVRQPFQYSLAPGLGTHGKMSAQVVNKFSLNILGGYVAGVNGIELGGLFNIDKKDVQYIQIAGLFNTVGGSVKGVQAAGLHNGVLGSTGGVQVAGLSNSVKDEFTGFQAAGITNSARRVGGLQLAGISNICKTTMNGVQIAGVFNYTKNLKGVQVGLINIADSSSGYSIGILNFIHNGYHKLSVSYNDALDLNIAYKTGNRKLYSILMAATKFGKNKNIYALGCGFGRSFIFTSSLSLTTELVHYMIYEGSWKHLPQLDHLQPSLQIKLSDQVALFVGPSFSIYYGESTSHGKNYGSVVPTKNVISFSEKDKGWFGGQVGITFF